MNPKIKIALLLLGCLACVLYFVGTLEFAGGRPFSLLTFVVASTGILALFPAVLLGVMAIDTYHWYFRN